MCGKSLKTWDYLTSGLWQFMVWFIPWYLKTTELNLINLHNIKQAVSKHQNYPVSLFWITGHWSEERFRVWDAGSGNVAMHNDHHNRFVRMSNVHVEPWRKGLEGKRRMSKCQQLMVATLWFCLKRWNLLEKSWKLWHILAPFSSAKGSQFPCVFPPPKRNKPPFVMWPASG